jgi:mxaA protein
MQKMRFKILIITLFMSMPVLAIDTKITLDRSWGLLVGDRVSATIVLPVPAKQLDPHSLPQHDKRYGPWLYLLDSELQPNRLKLHFQLINVPAENRNVASPVLELRTLDGEFITVPAVPMQIGSFLQPTEEGGARPTPRADARLQPQPVAALQWQLWIALSLLIVSSLIWLAWHFGLRPSRRLPFAAAMFELNKMRLLGRRDNDAASRSLHHAFNRSAGRVIVNSELNALWQACPWLKPLKADISHFYSTSEAHYFSPSASEYNDFEQVLKLARACREKERMA